LIARVFDAELHDVIVMAALVVPIAKPPGMPIVRRAAPLPLVGLTLRPALLLLAVQHWLPEPENDRRTTCDDVRAPP
jgi:hypothetical protein